jgi:hypothetical protein
MGGDVTVRSTPGAGSVFTLWLPAASVAATTRQEWRAPEEEGPRLRGLADLGELLLREIEAILEALTVRIREEDSMPGARTLKFSQLTDHYPSFLADLGGMLITVEESGGQPSALIADGTEIQRLVSEKHGAQRARLGWRVEDIRHEYVIMRNEIARLIRRRARAIPDTAVDEGLIIIDRVLEQAEEASIRGFLRTRASDKDDAATSSLASVERSASVPSHG